MAVPTGGILDYTNGVTGGIMAPPAAPSGSVANYTSANAAPTTATAVGYEAKNYQVTPEQTVEQRANNLIRADSPIMQQADVRARAKMAAMGQGNSSLAVEAGQKAVLDAAVPIASQDAAAYNKAMTDTSNAINAQRQFTAGATNTASGQNAQLGTQVNLSNADAVNKQRAAAMEAENNRWLAGLDASTRMDLGRLDSSTRMDLGNLDAATRVQLGQLDASTRVNVAQLDATTRTSLLDVDNQYKKLLQSDQSAQHAYNQASAAIANIANNTNLSEDAKRDATATQLSLLNEAMRAIQGIAVTPAQNVAELNLGQYYQPVGGLSELPLKGGVPTGGRRDANGNVYNAAGALMDWRGPTGQAVYVGRNDQAMTQEQWNADTQANQGVPLQKSVNGGFGGSPTASTAPTGGTPSGSAPTGTVTNPGASVTPAAWRPGMPAPAGYRVVRDNRAGDRLVRA